ncbi:hypothetical protein H5T56_03265 [Candidatus Bipolaricaulota bacterium]|nr:hypothetical protein [Candidatus Bipolaricaulota bacterium]
MEVTLHGDGHVELILAGKTILRGFDFLLRLQGATLSSKDFLASPWEESLGSDKFGAFRCLKRRLSHEGTELLEERLFLYDGALRHEIRFLTEVSGLLGSRDFLDPAVWCPLFFPAPEASYFLCTFGLDGEGGDYPGGYWPEARWGKVGQGFPPKPFAPLVIYREDNAMAVAPGELFLLSPLGAFSQGVGRALAGDFPKIPAGTVLSTWFVAGKDPGEALRGLGEIFLIPKGTWRQHPLLSRLGYWNAYGSYYTELIHPMEEKILRSLAAEFRAKGIPVGYFGLDLWYPYERIGQALEFRPDKRKYPRGLQALLEETEIPFVLHLSALSPRNSYGTDGVDPQIYGGIGKELRRQGGIGVWHDWLRTWQFLTRELLSDPWAAERWFSGMCQEFREVGLPVLLCMQTMGMVLASTKEPNVISARSYTDHLFSLKLALRRAAKTDPHLVHAWQNILHIWLQNLLVGYVQWALGLAPFHDLFLSRKHPGFGGERAWEEAVLRALSCGPVGFGDACGMADPALLLRLVLPDGRLAQPARPPEPVWSTLGSSTPVFWTETRAGELTWVYVLILNLTEEEKEVRVDPPLEGDFLSWDLRAEGPGSLTLRVLPSTLAYRVLLPKVHGVGLLGFPELLVPMPAEAQVEILRNRGNWCISLPKGMDLSAVFDHGKMVPAKDLVGVEVQRRG